MTSRLWGSGVCALVHRGFLSPRWGQGSSVGQVLCWVPLSPTPSVRLPKSSRTPRDSKCRGLRGALALFLSGCVNLGVCLSFLIWKSGNNSIYM